MVNMKDSNIEVLSKCKCGHISIKFDNNAWNTMTEKTFNDLEFTLCTDVFEVYQCDACINNWTIENGEFELGVKRPLLEWK